MKRDMDLVRLMLLIVEALPAGRPGSPGSFVDLADRATIAEHATLLLRQKLLEGSTHSHSRDGPTLDFTISRITWDGYEYLDSIRNPETWSEVKKTIAKRGGDLTFELIKAVATQLMKHKLGLPPG